MSDFGAFGSSDPTADFLAREKEILGDDAAAFSGGAPATTAMGDMDAFPPVDAFGASPFTTMDGAPAAATSPGALAGAGITDGFGDDFQAAASTNLVAAIPLPSSPAGGQSAQRQTKAAKFLEETANSQQVPSPSATPQQNVPEIESEAIRKWREEFAQLISERDAKEARIKQETIEKAKRDIDKFYEDYNNKRERALSENKALQEQLMKDLNDTVTGTYWERVLKHIELVSDTGSSGSGAAKGVASNVSVTKKAASAGSGGDTTRFKQVLLALKADKNTAPGA